jgi:hypothetical protein
MLPDPLSVTYNSVAKSIPRASAFKVGPRKRIGIGTYVTADQEFSVFTTQDLLSDKSQRAEILLGRSAPDPDSNPFTDSYSALPNRFGLVYETNSLKYASATDIPLLRSALLSLVNTAFELRLIGGEY